MKRAKALRTTKFHCLHPCRVQCLTAMEKKEWKSQGVLRIKAEDEPTMSRPKAD